MPFNCMILKSWGQGEAAPPPVDLLVGVVDGIEIGHKIFAIEKTR